MIPKFRSPNARFAPFAAVFLVSASSYGAPTESTCRIPQTYDLSEQPPLRERPADPWLAVDGDRPRVALPKFVGRTAYQTAYHSNIMPREDIAPCDARHDHCLRDCTWFVFWKSIAGAIRGAWRPTQWVAPSHFSATGTFVMPHATKRYDFSEDADYEAYRTVPATKRLLRPGVKVVVPSRHFTDPTTLPANEVAAFDVWSVGTLYEVDWDAGTLYLERVKPPIPIAAARVVVLSYAKSNPKVQLAPGFSRDEIVVKPEEIVSPRQP